jgi:hypothetical protein
MQGIWLPVCSDVMGEGWRVGGIAGTGFTCFTGTKVQKLTQLLRSLLQLPRRRYWLYLLY